MRLAIATRGTLTANAMLARLISMEADDFDTARQFLGTSFRKLSTVKYDDESERFAWENGIDLFVAGWSKTGPAAFVISTHNTGYKVQDIPYVVATPVVPDADFKAFSENPIANMPALLATQARIDSDVGGFMNVTIVSEREIVSYSAGPIDVLPISPAKRPEPILTAAFSKHLRKDR